MTALSLVFLWHFDFSAISFYIYFPSLPSPHQSLFLSSIIWRRVGPFGTVFRHAPLQLRAQPQSVSKDRLAQTVQQREVNQDSVSLSFPWPKEKEFKIVENIAKAYRVCSHNAKLGLFLCFQPSRATSLKPKAITEGAELRSVVPGNSIPLSLPLDHLRPLATRKRGKTLQWEYERLEIRELEFYSLNDQEFTQIHWV